MKSLVTLIKWQKTRVDEQRLMLAKLQERLDLIDRAVAMLQVEMAREQVAAQKNPEQSVTYGAFLEAAVKRGRLLEKERQIAVAAVEAARAVLAELFEEQKRYEIAEETRMEAERRAEATRETKELDEIGGVTHQRNKST